MGADRTAHLSGRNRRMGRLKEIVLSRAWGPSLEAAPTIFVDDFPPRSWGTILSGERRISPPQSRWFADVRQRARRAPIAEEVLKRLGVEVIPSSTTELRPHVPALQPEPRGTRKCSRHPGQRSRRQAPQTVGSRLDGGTGAPSSGSIRREGRREIFADIDWRLVAAATATIESHRAKNHPRHPR